MLNTWELSILFAFAIAVGAALFEAPFRKIPRATVWELFPSAFLGGLIGAHLNYMVMVAPPADWREFINIFQGTTFQGGILGGLGVFFLYSKIKKISIWKILDVSAPGISLAQTLGRIGCHSIGCCFGKPTSWPFGVVYTNLFSPAPRGIPLHPAQLYEASLNLLLALFLHSRLVRKDSKDGEVIGYYLAGYGIIRFLTGFLRNDDAGNLLLGMAHSQYMGLAMAFFGILIIRRAASKGRRF